MKPFGKRIAMAVVCAATLTSPLLLSGCSMSELWQGTEQSRKEIAQRSEQDQVQLFNQYVKAISRFNRMAVMFDYANRPTLNELKAGQHLTVFNAPNFKQLQKELEEAKQAGVPYDEMKEPLDKLLSKLNEITPVAEELDAYYKSKGYTTDNYAKEQQLGPKYVQLYEQFIPIYADFDNLMHKINTDRLQQRLQQLRDAGKKNAAAAQEVSLRLTAVLEKLDSEKEPDVNAINQELQAIGDLANGISSPNYDTVKTSVNSTIGAIRTYMGSKQDNDYKHMVEAYNRYISNMNTTNMNELDQ